MAYSINLTNGNLLVTLADGEVNTANSSITLIGRNVSTYGESLNENIVHMLENFASDTEPTSPLEGQLWMDTTSGDSQLKVRISGQWVGLSTYVKSSTTPTGLLDGDLWYDTTTGQIKVKLSSGFVVVGPINPIGFGDTTVKAEIITDTFAVDHEVLSFYVSGTRVAIVNKDAQFSTVVSGFTTVKPGINLNTGISNVVFNVTANNSQALNSLTSDKFMRTDQDTSTTGNLAVTKNITAAAVTANLSGNGAGITDLTGAAVTGYVALSTQANTALKFSTARNISLSGNVVGNVDFDGSANVVISTAFDVERLRLTGGTLSGQLNANAGLQVNTATANLLVATGNAVGIKTSNPITALDVVGGIRIVPVVSPSTSGTITLDALSTNHQVNLSGSTTFAFSNFSSPGQIVRLVVVGTENTITWPSEVYWPNGAVPNLANGTKKIAVVTLIRANTIVPDLLRPDANFILATYVSY